MDKKEFLIRIGGSPAVFRLRISTFCAAPGTSRASDPRLRPRFLQAEVLAAWRLAAEAPLGIQTTFGGNTPLMGRVYYSWVNISGGSFMGSEEEYLHQLLESQPLFLTHTPCKG